jgi:hypothetical protein
MFSLDPNPDSVSFEVIGSNVSQVATFGSDTNSSFLKIYANDPGSNTGFLMGTSNVDVSTPVFNIGQINENGMANCNICISNNNIGIGTMNPVYMLHIEGKVYAADTITAYSDIRMKKNVENISNALEKVGKLRGVTYDRIDTNERQLGVIAQEVQAVLPEVVSESYNGLSVAYGNMVGLLIEAVKELTAEVKVLRTHQQMQL